MMPRTRAGFLKFEPAGEGSAVALVAPASPFDRASFDRGVEELTGLGMLPVFDDSVFAREAMVAGPADVRAAAFVRAWDNDLTRVILAVRGGYGSVEILPYLERGTLARRPAFVGYSDVTSIHVFLNCQLGRASVHGAMIDGRLAVGTAAYDRVTFLASLGETPLGEISADGVEVIRQGDARGALLGGTLTQLVASLGTPYAFDPPSGSILFLDEVNERPYKLRRMLTQLRFSGRLAKAAGIVFGELPGCTEPSGSPGARETVAEVLADFPGPVIVGFPSGHTTTPLVSVPFGVEVRLAAAGSGRLIFDEAAAG
jgi:muramoyltetrapeptide carboxypeptidase